MDDFRIQREGKVDLEFRGEVLAQVSSLGKPNPIRWTEITIYRTDSGKYVVHQIGRTLMRGEKDRSSVTVVLNPEDVAAALERRTNDSTQPYLTNLAVEALSRAAQEDEELAGASVERI